MQPRLGSTCLACTLVLLNSLSAVHSSAAQELTATVLYMESPQPVVVGELIAITVHLSTSAGDPVASQQVMVFLDAFQTSVGLTDASGVAIVAFRHELDAGTYELKAAYDGSTELNLQPSTTSVQLVMVPADVVIRTVPPLPGVRIAWDQSTLVTDETGSVQMTVDRRGPFHVEVLPLAQGTDSRARVEFSRWNDEIFLPGRDVKLPLHRTLQVGFLTSYEVLCRFVDQAGKPVDPGRVSSIVLGVAGTHLSLQGAGPFWLPTNRLLLRIGAELHSLPTTYSVESVIIDGTNAIKPGPQHFEAGPDAVWEIPVLLYTATLTAQDALFNFPFGRGVALTYPDATTRRFVFGSDGEVQVPALARGSYQAQAFGGAGLSPALPFILAGDRTISLPVFSPLDVVVGGVLPLIVAIGLLFIGRPQLLHQLRRQHKPDHQAD